MVDKSTKTVVKKVESEASEFNTMLWGEGSYICSELTNRR